jgi:hypothetical protein
MTLKRIKRRFYKQEKARTKLKVSKIRAIVDEVLQEDFGRRLYRLSKDDEHRLLTLYTWRDRYKVSIKWMLKILIKIWTKKFARFKINSSLGCRVATLVGKKSEEIIREEIYKEFSHGENLKNWKQSEQDKIVKLVQGSTETSKRERKYSSILEAKTPEAYIKQYERELRWNKQKTSSKSQKLLTQVKEKPFRNNPFQ